jgi:hypothetical protein
VVTACQVVDGMLSREDIEVSRIESEMKRALRENGIQAFCEANVAPDFVKGAIDIAQINGVGKLRANTVMFGWPNQKEKLVSILSIMRTISKIGKSTLIARLDKLRKRRHRLIDIWWGGMENNGDLMLLLAYLLRMNPGWDEANIVLRSIVKEPGEKERMEENLSGIIRSVRIKADREVVVIGEDQRIEDVIKKNSGSADIVFFGLMIPDRGEEAAYAERLVELSEGLPSVVYVRNASEFSGRLL